MTDQPVIIGMDPHKSSNTIVVMTRDETMLTRAVEGANGVGRSVARRLVAFDEVVFDVPAKLATRVRVYSTGHGTNGQWDASRDRVRSHRRCQATSIATDRTGPATVD